MSRQNERCGFSLLKKTTCLGVMISAFLLNSPAYGDEDHYTNQLIGDRAAGMGGAYTAISDDPAGTYYNPAGIVYGQAGNLTASANTFSTNEKTYDSVLGGRHDWKRESYSVLPNFFGITQPLGGGYVGLSFAAPDLLTEDQDQQFNESFPSSIGGIDVFSYTINIHKTDNTYKFGPSYARELNRKLSIGLTGFFHYREKDFIKNEYVLLDNITGGNSYRDYEWTNFYEESFEYGFEPILGIMWTPVEKLSVGLRVSQVQVFSSDTTFQTTSRSEILGDVSNSRALMANFDNEREHPVNARLGLAYFASESLLVSGDLSYNSSVSDSFFGDRDKTWDFALGMEWYFSPKAALRMGFFSQSANTFELVADEQNQGEHLDLYGVSASLTRFSRNSSITAGFTINHGEGEAQVFTDNPTIQGVEAIGYSIFLSTSYSY
jgi:long-chain fatty acid transport protein